MYSIIRNSVVRSSLLVHYGRNARFAAPVMVRHIRKSFNEPVGDNEATEGSGGEGTRGGGGGAGAANIRRRPGNEAPEGDMFNNLEKPLEDDRMRDTWGVENNPMVSEVEFKNRAERDWTTNREAEE